MKRILLNLNCDFSKKIKFLQTDSFALIVKILCLEEKERRKNIGFGFYLG